MSQVLLSIPPHLNDYLSSKEGKKLWSKRIQAATDDSPTYIDSDPRSRRLGSGGGTVNLLHQAWVNREHGKHLSLYEWLSSDQKLIIHAGGQSRRLPSYAAVGKIFMPIPRGSGLQAERYDQMLADFQIPAYQQVLHEAGRKAAVLVTAGDVWLEFDPLQTPVISSDICCLGMHATASLAKDFGVFFVDKKKIRESHENPIRTFLQKPSVGEIASRSRDTKFLVDTGMWLLSAEALILLFKRCGWNNKNEQFDTEDGFPAYLDLYTEIGTVLSRSQNPPAELKKLGWNKLTSSVVPLKEARFFHLGSSKQVFDSFHEIQAHHGIKNNVLASCTPPTSLPKAARGPVWLDSVQSRPIDFRGYNFATGLPKQIKIKRFDKGVCLELLPYSKSSWILRPYHINDALRGKPSQKATICGSKASTWLEKRSLALEDLDVFDLPIYPILEAENITQKILDWFFTEKPDAEAGKLILKAKRISAAQIPDHVNFERFFKQRLHAYKSDLIEGFESAIKASSSDIFAQDFSAIADYIRKEAPELKTWLEIKSPSLLKSLKRPELASRLLMLLAEINQGNKKRTYAQRGYKRLQDIVLASNQFSKVIPKRSIKDDQIVWARSPVRLDLAGGWTDTPPHCFEYGGSVINAGVLLNGQPPIQVFVRPIQENIFRIRSIDLGSAEEIKTYKDLSGFTDPKSNFSLAKAALALCGFFPDFSASRKNRSLATHIAAFGSGLEITLLSAVPKGSGLGTSSILGATLLSALNRACGLGWNEVDLYQRVLAMEQLVTTGGGWQDQAGALFKSIKLIETTSGLSQSPKVTYLSNELLGNNHANKTTLLYYTGITRFAKGILKEIVHDMFLGKSATLRVLKLIRLNTRHLQRALTHNNKFEFDRCIARSWELNKRLDPGTTTQEVEKIISTAGPDLSACKLLGAGGGGYMLLCASTPSAATRIKQRLEKNPPNRKARFVEFRLLDNAVDVSVS